MPDSLFSEEKMHKNFIRDVYAMIIKTITFLNRFFIFLFFRRMKTGDIHQPSQNTCACKLDVHVVWFKHFSFTKYLLIVATFHVIGAFCLRCICDCAPPI